MAWPRPHSYGWRGGDRIDCAADLPIGGHCIPTSTHSAFAQLQSCSQQPDSTLWEPAGQRFREERDCSQRKEFRIIHTQGYKAERTPGSEGEGYAKMP